MTLRKREKIMIAALGGLLYLLILFKFVILPSRTEIKDVNSNLKSIQTQKKQLDEDYKNIEQKKLDIVKMKAQGEKLNSYIMSNAGIIDAVEYLDRLVLVAGQLKGVSITAPVQTANATGSNYYETQIDFSATINQKKLYDLINYIEQGSLKAGIKKLSISSDKPGAKNYKADMSIALYSMDKESTDKFTEYGRHKLSEFSANKGIFFDPSASQVSPTATISNSTSSSSGLNGKGQPDIYIKEGSYLSAGPNLQIYGSVNNNDSINVKTNKPADVSISIEGNGYSIITKGDSGNDVSLTGALPDGDISMSVLSDLSDITENKDIKLNIKIKNNSTKRVNITLSDNSGRVTFVDRDDISIIGDSSKEKVLIY